jgi:hypothetical protein
MTPLERLAGILRQRQRWLLIALLGVLHAALLAEGDRAFGTLCWLVDVGLFILWQPFIYAERRLDFSALAVIALLLGCGIAFYGWWLLIVWVVILAALVGGRVMFIDHRPTRIFYLIAFAYLLVGAALLAGTTRGRECNSGRAFSGSRVCLGNAPVPVGHDPAAAVER